MARRKRKPKQRRRQNRAHEARKNTPGNRGQGPEKQEQTGAGHPSAGHEAQKPQYRWISVEHRDPDGNPTLSRPILESTYPRRYAEVPPGTELEVHVLAGYKPKPVMMIERKIYEIQSRSVQGWRRSGLIGVEVDGCRAHEADWFSAMRGVKLTISDPGRPGPHNEKTEYIVSDSSFDEKIVTLVDHAGTSTEHRLHEGTLNIMETWKSAWRRQGAEVLNLGFKLLLAPLLVGLGVGGTLLWVDRPSSPNADARQTTVAQSAPPVQTEERTLDDPAARDAESTRGAPEAAVTPAPPTTTKSRSRTPKTISKGRSLSTKPDAHPSVEYDR